MSRNVHMIYASEFSKSVAKGLPWVDTAEWGYWMKADGNTHPFNLMAFVVAGSGVFQGLSSYLSSFPTDSGFQKSIVPIKDSNRLNPETGTKFSAWKYVQAVRLDVPTPGNAPDYAKISKVVGAKVDNEAEAFSLLYGLFAQQLKVEKPLVEDAFVAELATVQTLIKSGIKIPNYGGDERHLDWISVAQVAMNASEPTKDSSGKLGRDYRRFLTDICLKADKLAYITLAS